MWFFPAVLLFPLFLLLLILRGMCSVAEADRLPHPLMAHRAAHPIDRMLRVSSEVGRQIRVGGEWLRVLLKAFLVDCQMARLAPVHLRYAHETHVLHEFRKSDSLTLERLRHRVEEV